MKVLKDYDPKSVEAGVWYKPTNHSSGWPTAPEAPCGLQPVVHTDLYLGLIDSFKFEEVS